MSKRDEEEEEEENYGVNVDFCIIIFMLILWYLKYIFEILARKIKSISQSKKILHILGKKNYAWLINEKVSKFFRHLMCFYIY